MLTILAAALLSMPGHSIQTAPADRPTTLTGHIEHVKDFPSAIFSYKRDLIVYLPPQYKSEPNRRFPVLYMHDGQNVMDGATSYIPGGEWRVDEACEGLIGAGLLEPIIVVGISNAGAERGNEYLPTQMTSPSMGKMGGRANDYGKMLMTEIMPMVNTKYRTKTGPASTGLCGSSFGGVITLHLGLTHPEVFGKLAVVSPSLWWDNGVMLKNAKSLPQKSNQRIWLDMGTREGGTDVSETLKPARDLRDILIQKGWRAGRDLAYYEDGGAEHNERAWAGRIDMILLFLFRS